MKFKVYVIMDEVAKEFSIPFFVKNKEVAMRQYFNLVKDLNVDDYSLYEIGEFDTELGKLTIFGDMEVVNETV